MSVEFITLQPGHAGGPLQVSRAIKAASPDLVHAHSTWAGVYTRVLGSRSPILYQPHCFAFEDVTRPRMLRSAFRFAERLLAPRTAGVVALSSHERASAQQLGHRDVFLVPNTPTVAARRAADFVRTPVVSMVGRIAPQKDPAMFGEIAALVRSVHPVVTFRWIGDGDSTMKRGLLESGVEVTGWLDDADLIEALGSSALYLHTAAYEGFPLSLLDACALGVPIIARDIPALGGMSIHKFSSATEAARLVGEAFDDERRLLKIGQASRGLIQQSTRMPEATTLPSVYTWFDPKNGQKTA